MNQQRWKEIEPIIDEALSLQSFKERKAFVEEQCKHNHELREQVIQLLINIKQAIDADFLVK